MNKIIKELKHNVNDLTPKKLSLVLLAAGKSSRFNGVKLAQSIQDINAQNILLDQPLLLHGLDKLNYLAEYLSSIGVANKVVVVLGAHHQQLKKLLPISTAYIINHQSQDGLSTSVQAAIGIAESSDSSDLLLALADHIGVSYQDYINLVDLWLIKQGNVCASYQSQLGVPAIFSRGQFPALSQLKGDQGAKPLLHQLASENNLTYLDLPNAVSDIDTRNDLIQWQQLKLNKQ